jgi:uncharacterized protein (TIGR02145 family)
MKKTILFLSIFLIALSIYAQEPIVKFYLDGGNVKTYNIAEISNFSFIKAANAGFMRIYTKDSLQSKIYISDVDNITIDDVNGKPGIFNIHSLVENREINLKDIDSIVFYPTDPDNFETVTIGTQVWMTKNLDVDHYRNGDSIPQVTDPTQWKNLTTGAWCNYNNSDSLGKIYGKLYNWNALNDPRGLAPNGYHVPSDAEWTILSTYLGGESIAGGKMKETGTSHWKSPNTGATNSSGFSGLPGGCHVSNGSYGDVRLQGYWWSATEDDAIDAWCIYLSYNNTLKYTIRNFKVSGFSVRCVKD